MALSNGPNLGLLVNAAQGEAHFAEQQRLLRGLDALVQPSVKDKDLATPPGSPADGDRYIVAAAPTGAWVGHAAEIARWSSVATAWDFYVPKAGWRMYVQDEAVVYTYSGAVWIPALIVDTAGEGGFWGVTVHHPFLVVDSVVVATINKVNAWQFVLPFRVKVANLTWQITTLEVGKFVGIGIYNKDKNILLQAKTLATVAEVRTESITPVTVEPGVYWFAFTADGTTVKTRNANIAGSIRGIFNKNNLLHGLAANDSTAGVLPATLGTISDAGSFPPITYFES